jgi:hypothetical protein
MRPPRVMVSLSYGYVGRYMQSRRTQILRFALHTRCLVQVVNFRVFFPKIYYKNTFLFPLFREENHP